MSFLDYFRAGTRRTSTTAATAKERLQIIVAHERGKEEDTNYLPLLQKELIAVISKYVNIDPDQVKVALDRDGDCSVLELNITLPEKVVAGETA